MPNGPTLWTSFADATVRHADEPAVLVDGRTVTYSELRRSIDHIASRLVSDDAGAPDRPVAVLAPHGLGSLTGFLAGLRSGRPVAVLDPGAPPEAQARRLDLLGAETVLVADEGPVHATVMAGRSRIDLDLERGSPFPVADAVWPDADIDDPAIVLFTSGTTGDQRAIVHAHRSIVRNIRVDHGPLDLGSSDVAAWTASLTTISGVSDSMRMLLRGGCLVPVDLSRLAISEAMAVFESSEVTIAHLVPTVFRRMVSMGGSDPFQALRLLHLGGEPVVSDDFVAFTECVPRPARFLDNLGSSEVPTFYRTFLGHDDVLTDSTIAFRTPVPGKQVRLLDDARREILDGGRPGDVVVDTSYGAIGSWSAESGGVTPFADGPYGVPRYALGDRAQWGSDGSLEHMGRADARQKRSGQWIDLTAIEAEILSIDGVRECVVTWAGGPASGHPIAHCITELPTDRLRSLIGGRLDAHAVPVLAVHDELPILPNGKADRQRIAAFVPPMSSSAEREPAPLRDGAVFDIVADVLGVEGPIPASASFVDLGGDSIHAVELIHRLARDLAIDLDSTDLFAAPDLGAFVDRIGTASTSGAEGIYLHAPDVRPDRPVIACVGDQRLMTPLVSRFDGRASVVHLRLDGLQTETTRSLDIPGLVAAYRSELRDARIDPAVVLGFSYGGLVAIALTGVLDRPVAGILAVEPSVPGEAATAPGLLTRIPQRVGRSMRRVRRQTAAWEAYRPTMRRNIETFDLGTVTANLVLASGESYRDQWHHRWGQSVPDAEWLDLPVADHLAAIDPRHAESWLTIVERWVDPPVGSPQALGEIVGPE